MQENLPLHLQYRRDEEVVRAEQNLQNIVEATARYLQVKNHIQPKSFIEQNIMPILGNIVNFFSILNADLLKYVQSVFIHQMEEGGESTDTLVGIPQEDVDSILDELEAIDKFLVKIDSLGGNKKELVEEVKKDAKTIRNSIADLSRVIQEFSLEEVNEGEEEFIEFDADDEEEPLIADEEEPKTDEPLIAAE